MKKVNVNDRGFRVKAKLETNYYVTNALLKEKKKDAQECVCVLICVFVLNSSGQQPSTAAAGRFQWHPRMSTQLQGGHARKYTHKHTHIQIQTHAGMHTDDLHLYKKNIHTPPHTHSFSHNQVDYKYTQK